MLLVSGPELPAATHTTKPRSAGRTKPDVLFPGTGIISCRAQGTELGSPLNSVYTEMSGTSMATPHASGVAALLLETEPGLTPAEIKELIMTTAVDLGLEGNTQGAGRGDVGEAITQIRVPEDVSQTPGCLTQLPALLELLRGLW